MKNNHLDVPAILRSRVRSKTMETKRYTNRFHGVFDFPHSAGLTSEGTEPPRIMMIYERATDITKFEIVDKGLPADIRDNMLSWLHKNIPSSDDLNGTL